MQNFDPKLYDHDPNRIPPGASTDRAIKRGENIHEDTASRRKFSLDSKKKETNSDEALEEKALPSAFDLMAGKGKIKEKSEEQEEESHALSSLGTNKQEIGKEEKEHSENFTGFASNHPQELIATVDASSTVMKSAKTSLEELLKQMVDALVEIKKQGETELLLTLKDPPLFEGAKLQLNMSDTARGQFNISFSELSPDAKRLLDQQSIRDSLMQALGDKGFTVHIFIATTEKETLFNLAQGEKPQEEKRKKEDENDKE